MCRKNNIQLDATIFNCLFKYSDNNCNVSQFSCKIFVTRILEIYSTNYHVIHFYLYIKKKKKKNITVISLLSLHTYLKIMF